MFGPDSINYTSIRICYYLHQQNVFCYTRETDLELKFSFKLWWTKFFRNHIIINQWEFRSARLKKIMILNHFCYILFIVNCSVQWTNESKGNYQYFIQLSKINPVWNHIFIIPSSLYIHNDKLTQNHSNICNNPSSVTVVILSFIFSPCNSSYTD